MKREMIEKGRIRVENGPARRIAIATEALLDNNVTATHYQLGANDALGKPIVLGEPMTYLDYRNEWVWYVYRWDRQEKRWLTVAVEITKARALRPGWAKRFERLICRT